MKIFILLAALFLGVSATNAQWRKQTVDTRASLRGGEIAAG